MYRELKACRACGATTLFTPVMDLGVQPLANDFRLPGEASKGYAPLKVLYCGGCSLAQLSVVVDPEILYSGYPYVTSRSQTMLGHFAMLWQAINNECKPEKILEIGSNDGFFLDYCQQNGAKDVMGIDPAENLSELANSRGIYTVSGVFNDSNADKANRHFSGPDVVIARHVFCHIDDWKKFMLNMDVVCRKNTLVVIEVPYVMDTLERVEFDQIYHEHLSYLSINAMNSLLEGTTFTLHKVTRFPIHGGSVVIMLRRRDWGDGVMDTSVSEFLYKEEHEIGDKWADFGQKANYRINKLRDQVNESKQWGVCGYGASAKSTVWIQACGFKRDQIQCIVDETKQKQNRLSPGTDIPVRNEDVLKLFRYSVLFAWNFKEEIIKKAKASGWEGAFIIP